MKNAYKLKAMLRIAGIVAFVAVIGFSMAGCDTGNGNGHTHIQEQPPLALLHRLVQIVEI